MIAPLSRTDGFTLVEAMIALFFLSFMVGEMAMVDVGAKRSAQLARQITKANTFADEGVEKTRNVSYANLQVAIGNMNEACCIGTACPVNLAANPPLPTVPANVARCTSIAPIEGVFTRTRIVTPLDAANAVAALTASGKADVVVTVTFNDARGTPQRVSVASVMTKF